MFDDFITGTHYIDTRVTPSINTGGTNYISIPWETNLETFISKFNETKINDLNKFTPKEVIFNNPATIVFWRDGSKTIVKCGKDDIFDKEKGLALCFMKKALGNKGNFNDTIKKFVKYEDEK